MHISEGFLSNEIIITTTIISFVTLTVAIYKTKEEEISKIALCSSLFFVASLIHIPIGATNIHLMLLGVIGILIGFNSIIAIAIALLIEALLLSYGGFSTLGANSLNMFLGAISSYFIFSLLKERINKTILYFLVGFSSVAVTSIALSITLYLSNKSLLTISTILLSFNLATALIEGAITIYIFKFLNRFNIKLT